MAKKTINFYLDSYEFIQELSTHQKGLLLEAIFEYEINGTTRELEAETKMAFLFVKAQHDRDKEKYEKKCNKNKENIGKRWNTTIYDRIRSNTNAYERIRSDTKNTDKDTDTDTDTDKDTDKENTLSSQARTSDKPADKEEASPVPAKKKVRKTDERTEEALRVFGKAYRYYNKCDYIPSYGEDMKALSRVLKAKPDNGKDWRVWLKAILMEYFGDENDFKGSHSVRTFCGSVNRLQAAAAKKRMPRKLSKAMEI